MSDRLRHTRRWTETISATITGQEDWLREEARMGEYVKENPWGIDEGMSLNEVDQLLVRNGFQQESVELPAQFGSDPPGYKYPCWRNTQKGMSVTSTFKHGSLLEFSWW